MAAMRKRCKNVVQDMKRLLIAAMGRSYKGRHGFAP